MTETIIPLQWTYFDTKDLPPEKRTRYPNARRTQHLIGTVGGFRYHFSRMPGGDWDVWSSPPFPPDVIFNMPASVEKLKRMVDEAHKRLILSGLAPETPAPPA